MGIKGMMRNKKKTFKSEKPEKWRRQKKREKKKQLATKDPKTLEIEDIHLYSTQKLRNKIRNPRNNIKISGKKRRRLTKRLGHALKEKSQMEVESAPSTSKGGRRKGKQANEDEEMEELEESSQAVPKTVAINAMAEAVTQITTEGSWKKKKKRGGKKHKKGAASQAQEPLFDTTDGWEDVEMADS